MKLVSYASRWYKLWSVWLFVIVGVYQWLEQNVAVMASLIPHQYHGYIGLALAVLGIASRLITQPSLHDYHQSDHN